LILINALEYMNFPADPSLPESILEQAAAGTPFEAGQYAFAWMDGKDICLARDPLGCNKLFYGLNPSGDLVAASRIERALEMGVSLDDLASCPPGHLVRWGENGATDPIGLDISTRKESTGFSLPAFQNNVRQALEHVMAETAKQWPDAAFAVCLSGGMDSSVIAALARDSLPDIQTFSFSYLSSDDMQAWRRGMAPKDLLSTSEDFRAATLVAEALGIPLQPVFRIVDAIGPAASTAVRLCQDWRDFNVHCAVVNLFLAEDIHAHFPDRPVVVLTGDLMNEYVCDYHEETINGTIYYPQPRISVNKRRRFFIRGLDAGDREIGVFSAFGLNVVQAYASVADQYVSIPSKMLEDEDIKTILNGHLLPPGIEDVVGTAKRRAQVGGADGGTLGAFHRMGIDQDCLKRFWAESLPPAGRGDNPEDIIQVGRYRTTARSA